MNFNRHIKRELVNEYAGSEKKRTIILDDGYKYLLKFPDPIREKNNDLSYINNAISEYLGCKIIKSIGLSVQDVILGEYTDERGKTKVACACKDVRNPGEIMHPVQTIALSSLDEETRNEATVDNATYFAENFKLLPKDEILDFYYNMFVVDSFIGNRDRHNGNWAILTDNDGNARISPIYDCGSSLSPMLSDNELNNKNLTNDALSTYSVIKDENGKRISYQEYMLSGRNKYLDEAIKRIVPNIDMRVIGKIIDDIEYISDKRKEFYKSLLSMRYEKIMIPALKRQFEKDKDEINEKTKNLSPKDLKDNYEKYIKPLRESNEILFKSTDAHGNNIYIRKATKNVVIISNQSDEVIGVASIRNDYNDIRDYICQTHIKPIAIEINPIENLIAKAKKEIERPSIENKMRNNNIER